MAYTEDMPSLFSYHSLPDPLSRCPFCEVVYLENNINPLKSRYGQEFCHAFCKKCKRSMLFSFERRASHILGLGMLTDCDGEDALRFVASPKITLDEVLEAYEALEKV